MPSEPTPEQMKQIGDAIAAGKKIEAIKLYRGVTGSGLKESKDFIDKLEVELRAKEPSRFPKKPVSQGCFSVIIVLIGIAVSTCVLFR